MPGTLGTDPVGCVALWALPVIQSVLHVGELEEFSVSAIRDGNGEAIILCATVVGEVFRWYARVPGQVAEVQREFQQRLANDLIDFVSESSFGWGILRTSGFALNTIE